MNCETGQVIVGLLLSGLFFCGKKMCEKTVWKIV